jgi:hypothetical protein
MPEVHIDMLWHERDARGPAHKWLRQHLTTMTSDWSFPAISAQE